MTHPSSRTSALRRPLLVGRAPAEVRLLSRAAVPGECRPWLNDPRPLGVAVREIAIRDGIHMDAIAVDHPALGDGWWDVERDENVLVRWTNGDAALALPLRQRPAVLEIQLAGEMVYPLSNGNARACAPKLLDGAGKAHLRSA